MLSGDGGLQGVQREHVALRAEPADDALAGRCNHGMVAEFLPRMHIRDMKFHHRYGNGLDRIVKGDRGMGKGAGIDGDTGSPLAGLMHPINEHALVIALAKLDSQSEFGSNGRTFLLDIGQGLAAVDARFAFSQHVEVGTVEDENRFAHRDNYLFHPEFSGHV